MNNTEVILALGGNLGNVPESFKKAIDLLNQNQFIVLKKAKNHLTKAENCESGTPDFINSALLGTWSGTPDELLALCQKIEIICGRPKIHSSTQSRTLDIDIITFGNQIINSDSLKIPHPYATKRFFVLKPISEIKPDLTIPQSNATVFQLLDKLVNHKNGNCS